MISMNKKLIPVIASGLLIAACGGCGNGHKENAEHLGKGGIYYGGVFRMNEVTGFRSLFPDNVTDVIAHNIANQVYEGLVKLSPKDLTIIPSLAEKWTRNDSATVWTFYLRKGVKFQDDPCFPDGKGRNVTAKDFKWCLDQLCVASPQNAQFDVTFKNRVVGADEYYKLSIDKKPLPAGGVSGIKVIDDYTLQITLVKPFAGFLNILIEPGCWIYPKEALDKYGLDMRIHPVGTGPFQVKDVKEDQAIVLVRNPNYWDIDSYGNQLPYLNAIKYTFVHEKKSELLEFQQDNLEMMYQLPIEIIPQILGQMNGSGNTKVDYSLQVAPAMSSYFFGFQTQNPVFSNKLVRQALNYAIDRDKIVTYTLQGEGIPGNYGIVPPQAFTGYDYKKLTGYSFDPDKARELLAKAGYPNGKGFPEMTLQTNSDGGERNIQIAEVMQKMFKENLNINVKINAVPLSEHLNAFERGKVPFFREGWIADYPDPQTFLSLLYGPNVPKDSSARSYSNPFRYVNPRFDSLYSKALVAINDSDRYRLYREADQAALDDAPYLCVFYEENYYLYHNYVKNFYGNGMDYLDLSRVYVIPANKRVSANPSPTPTAPQ